jgi:hypothetical protein
MYTSRIFFLIALTAASSIAHAQSTQVTAEGQTQSGACYVNNDDSEQPIISSCASSPAKTSSQVYRELLRAKEAGYVTFGELDYPPASPAPASRLTRTEVRAELARATQLGINTFGELEYPYENS